MFLISFWFSTIYIIKILILKNIVNILKSHKISTSTNFLMILSRIFVLLNLSRIFV